MRSQRMLFIATARIEVGAGLSLVCLPALVIWLLLGVGEPSPEALIVGRVGGAGLLAIGVACWLAHDDRGSRSQHGLLWGMLIYNVGACVVLAIAGLMMRMSGVAFWPALVYDESSSVGFQCVMAEIKIHGVLVTFIPIYQMTSTGLSKDGSGTRRDLRCFTISR